MLTVTAPLNDDVISMVFVNMFTFTCIFVYITLFLTALATLFLTLSLFSNEWEYMSYEPDKVETIAQANNHSVQWLSGKVARINKGTAISSSTDPPDVRTDSRKTIFYLVPAYGGVNKLCADIPEIERERMKKDGHTPEHCISYLSNEKVISKDSWVDRMRNLAMSCAIVSLILLGTSAPLGILGLIKKQISTIMVTGVMYILAAVFGIFNLVFMRFKRVKADGFYTSTVLDRGIPEEYMKIRDFTAGWPPSIEWTGLCLCFLASLFWLLLAKIFRFIILSPTLQ